MDPKKLTKNERDTVIPKTEKGDVLQSNENSSLDDIILASKLNIKN